MKLEEKLEKFNKKMLSKKNRPRLISFFLAKLVLKIALVFWAGDLFSQELNCRINVISQQVQGTNKQVFQTLQKELYEFMNNTRWTPYVMNVNERIDCTIMITISKQLTSDEFEASLEITSSRPVYGSNYQSTMLNFKDNNFDFQYIEYEPLEFDINNLNSNLIATLAYYAYVIIGLDYDSFGMGSGKEFYEKAERIVNMMQSSGGTGWQPHGDNNRYELADNLVNSRYDPIHECLYKYHRLGLDVLPTDPAEGRLQIAEALEMLEEIYKSKPGAMILDIFFQAKAEEIIKVFKSAYSDEKKPVYNLVKKINPSNANKYEAIIKEEKD